MADKAAVLEALSTIIDPDFQKDIVSLGFIKDLTIDGGHVSFAVELTTPACPIKDQFKAQAEQRVEALPGVDTVTVTMTARAPAARKARHRPIMPSPETWPSPVWQALNTTTSARRVKPKISAACKFPSASLLFANLIDENNGLIGSNSP